MAYQRRESVTPNQVMDTITEQMKINEKDRLVFEESINRIVMFDKLMNQIFRNPTVILLPATTYSTLNLVDGKLEGLGSMQRVGEATITIGYRFLCFEIFL